MNEHEVTPPSYSREACIAKMFMAAAKAHREMGTPTALKGAHAGKKVSNPSKTAAER